METSENIICSLLCKLHIKYELIHHPAVFTVEEAESLDILHNGYGCKNLFLKTRNNKSYYLLIMAKDKRADLKEIKKQINSSSLTFASKDELFNILGLMKGSVTPLGLINDKNHCVTLLIDDDITSKEKIGIHANTNTSTIWLSFENLIEIINHLGNPTKIINI